MLDPKDHIIDSSDEDDDDDGPKLAAAEDSPPSMTATVEGSSQSTTETITPPVLVGRRKSVSGFVANLFPPLATTRLPPAATTRLPTIRSPPAATICLPPVATTRHSSASAATTRHTSASAATTSSHYSASASATTTRHSSSAANSAAPFKSPPPTATSIFSAPSTTTETSIGHCEDVWPVSEEEWHKIMQEEAVKGVSENKKAKLHPKMWALAKKLFTHMEDSKWELAIKATNKTDFRRKILKNLVEIRRRVLTRDADSASLSRLYKDDELVWFYSFSKFKEHAKQHMKNQKSDNSSHGPNDAVRVFGILGLPDMRDRVTRLGIGRATGRADIDGPMNLMDETFTEVAKLFNDEAVVINAPPRADRLDTTPDPNDPARIAIERDYVWCKKVYVDWLKKYNVAMKKWKKGTGGGPGYPENYANWNTRDTELFGNYHASAGRSDALAWMYMLDKSVGFIFNVINDPPPPASVMQDGSTTMDPASRRGSARGLAGLEDLTSAVTSAVTNVTNLFQTSAENREIQNRVRNDEVLSNSNVKREDVIEMIRLLQDQRQVVEEDPDLGRRTKRLKSIQSALDREFDNLA